MDVKLVSKFSSRYTCTPGPVGFCWHPLHATRVLNTCLTMSCSRKINFLIRTLVCTDGPCRRTCTASAEWNLENFRICLPISSWKLSKIAAYTFCQDPILTAIQNHTIKFQKWLFMTMSSVSLESNHSSKMEKGMSGFLHSFIHCYLCSKVPGPPESQTFCCIQSIDADLHQPDCQPYGFEALNCCFNLLCSKRDIQYGLHIYKWLCHQTLHLTVCTSYRSLLICSVLSDVFEVVNPCLQNSVVVWCCLPIHSKLHILTCLCCWFSKLVSLVLLESCIKRLYPLSHQLLQGFWFTFSTPGT